MRLHGSMNQVTRFQFTISQSPNFSLCRKAFYFKISGMRPPLKHSYSQERMA